MKELPPLDGQSHTEKDVLIGGLWFIISQRIEAQQVAAMIRSHRGTTENKLHWVKDMVPGLDASMIQASNPATLMALLRSWRLHCSAKQGSHLSPKQFGAFVMTCLLSFPSSRESALPTPPLFTNADQETVRSTFEFQIAMQQFLPEALQ